MWCKGAPYNSICTKKQQGVTRQPRDSLRLLPVDDRHKVKGPWENSIPIVLQQGIESRSAFIPINTTSACCAWKWSDFFEEHTPCGKRKLIFPTTSGRDVQNSQEGNGLMNGLILTMFKKTSGQVTWGCSKGRGGSNISVTNRTLWPIQTSRSNPVYAAAIQRNAWELIAIYPCEIHAAMTL